MGESWQWAYFDLLSHKNTWDMFVELDITATSQHGVACLVLVVKREHANMAQNLLESLFYGDIKRYDTTTLRLGVEWDEDYDHVVAYFE